MTGKSHIIDTTTYDGNRVVFSKQKLKEKSKIHPELKNGTFMKNVEKTLESPDYVYKDYEKPKKKRCLYKKYSVSSYVKVVLWIADSPYRVVTAFEAPHIKEALYMGLEIKV